VAPTAIENNLGNMKVSLYKEKKEITSDYKTKPALQRENAKPTEPDPETIERERKSKINHIGWSYNRNGRFKVTRTRTRTTTTTTAAAVAVAAGRRQ